MKKAKWIISFTLALSLFGSGVYAGTVLQTYKTVRGDSATVEKEEVHKNRIALKVNGVKASKPTWYANGTTYVPLRDAAELLGTNVTYNSSTMTAELTTKDSTPSTGTVGTRSNPVSLGKSAAANVHIYASSVAKSAVLDVTVNKITRGAAALQIVKEENQFNDTPAAGYEYIIVNVSGKVRNATTNDHPFLFYQWDFQAISQSGAAYDIPSVVTPDELHEKIYNNGSASGNMVWQVRTGENVLLNFEGADGKFIFFATK